MHYPGEGTPFRLWVAAALFATVFPTGSSSAPAAEPEDGEVSEEKAETDGEALPAWLEKRRDDPRFLGLYRELLAHVQKMDAMSEQLELPDFPEGKDWFNSQPLSFERELAGKITVLDFWTYCCINCIHVLPDLAALEKQYAGYPVAFVGVHSAKFANERVSENIRQAVLRYEIEHPVINDDEMFLWRRVGVRSWPSLLVVGPKANALLLVSGEGQKDVIDACIAAALEHYPAEAFRHDPLPIELERDRVQRASPLRFPGKLAIDAQGERLFISDSNHNRIVVTDLDGKCLEVVGSGRIGLVDGAFADCAFNRLQGMAYRKPYLYVADAENHAVRRVSFETRRVETLAGDGTQGRDYSGGGTGSAQRLSTPWDVTLHGQTLFIAMAGTHQIWQHDLEGGMFSRYSGDGSERNFNSSDPRAAAWAQPSGLTIGAGELFVADSESSTIRAIDLESGATRTIVGGADDEPRNLFAFGDVDGVEDEAKLQHPLGVLFQETTGEVIVADTYNHRLKRVEPAERRVKSWAGDGTAGHEDGPLEKARFAEPSGLALGPDGKTLFVADTNNHAIRTIDLENKLVATLELTDVPPPAPPHAPRTRRLADLPGMPIVRLQPLKLPASASGELLLKLRLPEGHKLTAGTDSRWQLLAGDEEPLQVEESRAAGPLESMPAEIAIPYTASEEGGLARIEAVAYFCKDEVNGDGGGACHVASVLFELPVEIDAETAAPAEPRALEHAFAPSRPGFSGLLEPKGKED